MNFTDAIRASLNRYADFAGRSRRAEYWYFQLFVVLLYLAIPLVLHGRPGFGFLLLSLAFAAFFIPAVAVNIRRLHDVDRSGWWLLIGFVPLLGFLLLLIWHCTPGTSGANRFGPDPKAA